MQTLANFTNMSSDDLVIMLVVALMAGLIRGFTGFALSATVIASLSSFIPPIELIPVCFGLEILASLMMGRDGVKNADKSIVKGLVIGSLVGVPLGLLALTQLDADLSKKLALGTLMFLSSLILFKVRASFLATNAGLYLSGLLAGITTGIAGVGGMVVALYVLAREQAAKQMRGSMVLFLMISEISTALYYFIYQIFTFDVARRVLVMAPLLVFGIWLGTKLFNPRFEPYYKPTCLILLIGLCGASLLRVIV